MNNFGIDHQSTFTAIALREESASAVARTVGDGRQLLIPNVVADGGAWGSDAATRVGCRGLDASDADRDRFWRGVTARLSSYIGRLAPNRENGYRVIASIASDLNTEAVALRARSAGLVDLELIAPNVALRTRWLTAASAASDERRIVVAVACGDRCVDVEAFVVDGRHVADRSGGATLTRTGHAYWSERLVAQLRDRLIETPTTPLEWNPAVQLSIRRAAQRLVRERGSFDWDGGLARATFAPVHVSLDGCRRWPETMYLAVGLAPAIEDELEKLSAAKADLILVGGIGAVWPFAADAANSIAPTWSSADPESDFAIGAAFWPEPARSAAFATSSVRLPIECAPAEETRRDSSPRPPWLHNAESDEREQDET